MTDTPRFAIPLGEDPDSPNYPAQAQAEAERVEELLGYAGAQVVSSIVPAEQSTPNDTTTYALLGTPDRCQGLEIPNDGDLLLVHFSALWKGAAQPCQAAIFLNHDGDGDLQLKAGTDSGAAAVQEADTSPNRPQDYNWLYSGPSGLFATAQPSADGDASGVTTGLVMASAAGITIVERLEAGTYDVSVKYKSSAGGGHPHITAKERRMICWTKEAPAP